MLWSITTRAEDKRVEEGEKLVQAMGLRFWRLRPNSLGMAMEHWIDSDRCTCCILNTAVVTMKYHEILDPIMIGVAVQQCQEPRFRTNLNVGSPPDSKLFVK